MDIKSGLQCFPSICWALRQTRIVGPSVATGDQLVSLVQAGIWCGRCLPHLAQIWLRETRSRQMGPRKKWIALQKVAREVALAFAAIIPLGIWVTF